MVRSILIASLSMVLCGWSHAGDLSSEAQNGGQCSVLKWNRTATVKPTMRISEPGRYCLDQDYEISCSVFEHGCAGKLIDIRADNVDVDMRGHTVTATGTRAYGGVWGAGKNIRIHHGTFKGVGIAVQLRQPGSMAKDPLYAVPAYPVQPDDKFQDTGLVVEEVDFVDVVKAIVLSGAGNHVLNNRIKTTLKNKVGGSGQSSQGSEAEPKVSIVSYGPNLIFKGNTVVQKTDNNGISAYVLYLRNADNAVIADNRIRVAGSTDKTVGIGLSNSRNVSLQNNVIEGAEVKVELDAASSELSRQR